MAPEFEGNWMRSSNGPLDRFEEEILGKGLEKNEGIEAKKTGSKGLDLDLG